MEVLYAVSCVCVCARVFATYINYNIHFRCIEDGGVIDAKAGVICDDEIISHING